MITACAHYENSQPIPCPPQCPAQCWPRHMFGLTWLGHWKLRRKHVAAWARAEVERTRPPVCDRPSCYDGPDTVTSRLEHGCIPGWNRQETP